MKEDKIIEDLNKLIKKRAYKTGIIINYFKKRVGEK